MYLSRKKYVGGNYDFNNVEGIVDIKSRSKQIPIDLNKVSYIVEEVGYWRKANAIHKWFVDNVQDGEDDCKNYYVSSSQLKELLELCKEVKKKAKIVKGQIKNGYTFKDGVMVPILEEGELIENADEIAEILPSQAGFFFGGTDYDEYYMEDIEYTIDMLERLIKEDDDLEKQGVSISYEYRSSW